MNRRAADVRRASPARWTVGKAACQGTGRKGEGRLYVGGRCSPRRQTHGLASKRLTIDFRKQTMEVSDSGERVAIDSDAIIVRARRRPGQRLLVDYQANGGKNNVNLDTGRKRSKRTERRV